MGPWGSFRTWGSWAGSFRTVPYGVILILYSFAKYSELLPVRTGTRTGTSVRMLGSAGGAQLGAHQGAPALRLPAQRPPDMILREELQASQSE